MRNKTDRMVTDGRRRRPVMDTPMHDTPLDDRRAAPALGTQAAHDMGCWCEGDKDGELCQDCPLRRMTGNPTDRARARTK